MQWVALYMKYRNPERDPLDIAIHGWIVEADTAEAGLEILEKRWDVPWRLFHLEIVPLDGFTYQTEGPDGGTMKVIMHK